MSLVTLPKDVLFEVLINLTPNQLLNTCLTASALNICLDENFWRLKLVKDYPKESPN